MTYEPPAVFDLGSIADNTFAFSKALNISGDSLLETNVSPIPG